MAKTERIELRMYGDSKLFPVEVERSVCPHCCFVQQYVGPKAAGDITYVCLGADNEEIRRVQTVLVSGALGLLCEKLSAEEVEAEMRELSVGSS